MEKKSFSSLISPRRVSSRRRRCAGCSDLDTMLAERDKLNADIQDVLDKQTEAWGIKVSNIEIKHIDLNENSRRRRNCSMLPGSWHPFARRCNSATWPRCSTLRVSGVRRSSSRSRWISCADGKCGRRQREANSRAFGQKGHFPVQSQSPCPLWVKSRYLRRKTSGPLYP
jgi:hypothetical protein